jgi:hypothetical protein
MQEKAVEGLSRMELRECKRTLGKAGKSVKQNVNKSG